MLNERVNKILNAFIYSHNFPPAKYYPRLIDEETKVCGKLVPYSGSHKYQVVEQWESVQTLLDILHRPMDWFLSTSTLKQLSMKNLSSWLGEREGRAHTKDLMSELGWVRTIINRSWSPVKQKNFMVASSLVPEFLIMPVKSTPAHTNQLIFTELPLFAWFLVERSGRWKSRV